MKPGVEQLKAEAGPNHIHMLITIPPKYAVSELMGDLKSKITLMIFDQHVNLKYKNGNGKTWEKG